MEEEAKAPSRRNNLGPLFKPKPGEIVVVCAWCTKEIRRKSGDGVTGISHGICPSCLQKLKERSS